MGNGETGELGVAVLGCPRRLGDWKNPPPKKKKNAAAKCEQGHCYRENNFEVEGKW